MTQTLVKKAFFQERGLHDALAGRNVNYATAKHTLANTIEDLSDDNVLFIPDYLIPLPNEFYSQQNWMKRGPSLPLPRYRREDLEKKIGPTRMRAACFQEAPLRDYVGGYQWCTTNNNQRKQALLTDCLEAARLFYFATHSEDQQIHVKRYSSKQETPTFGSAFVVEVPSRTRDEKYVFKMTHVPTEHTADQYGLWRNITSEGHTGGKKIGNRHEGCERKFYAELTFGRPELVDFFCAHEIAAYMAISKHEYDRQGRVVLQPFALPSARAVQFDKKLREHVFVEERRKNEKGIYQLRRRHLTIPEHELILWQLTLAEAKRGNNLFYARNLLQYHAW